MSEKLLWPAAPLRQKNSLLNSLVPDSAIAWSTDLNKLFQQNQLALKTNTEVTSWSLNDLKKQILSPNQKVRFDNTDMPVSKLFDSCKWLYLNTQNAENKYLDAIKNWISLNDGPTFFSLKNNLTNIYSRSLKRFNDINILIANYNRIWINAQTKDPFIRKIFEDLVKTKRLIEDTLEESKKAFYKVIEWLKAIELLKKIPQLKKDMAQSWKQVDFWRDNVKSQKNLDSERVQLKRYIKQLEDYMTYWTKLAWAIKNVANQPNQPDAKNINNLIDEYEKKLIDARKAAIAPPPAPKPAPAAPVHNEVASTSWWIENWEQNMEWNINISPNSSIIEAVKKQRAERGYSDLDNPIAVKVLMDKYKLHWKEEGIINARWRPIKIVRWPWVEDQCAWWVDKIVTNSYWWTPIFSELRPCVAKAWWTFEQKKNTANTMPWTVVAQWSIVAINIPWDYSYQVLEGKHYVWRTTRYYWHIGIVKSVNNDWTVSVISSNAFWTWASNWWEVTVTRYPMNLIAAFSKAPWTITWTQYLAKIRSWQLNA